MNFVLFDFMIIKQKWIKQFFKPDVKIRTLSLYKSKKTGKFIT